MVGVYVRVCALDFQDKNSLLDTLTSMPRGQSSILNRLSDLLQCNSCFDFMCEHIHCSFAIDGVVIVNCSPLTTTSTIDVY